MRRKFVLQNNRLNQEILCLLPTAVRLRLKTAYVLAHARYCSHSTNFPVWVLTCFEWDLAKKHISSQIVEFGCCRGRGFISNPLSLREWSLTMFSIIFCKVSTLNNVRQREKWPKKIHI